VLKSKNQIPNIKMTMQNAKSKERQFKKFWTLDCGFDFWILIFDI